MIVTHAIKVKLARHTQSLSHWLKSCLQGGKKMDQEQQAQKKYLEQQLEWTKVQALLLDKMDIKLREMKKIAEYASEHKLSEDEIDRLNGELNVLKEELSSLERQFNSTQSNGIVS